MNNLEDDKYLIWLTNINGIGLKKQKELIEIFGSAKNIFFANKKDIISLAGVSSNIAEKIISSKKEISIDRYLEKLYKKNIKFISINNESYPKLLLEIADPPLGLYTLGKIPDNNNIMVSIIGSRKCSEYGVTMAYKLSKDLANKGIIIVSGMAKGIDGMAHKGALKGGGKTVAVLGCGVDICYPSENRDIYENIIANGCIISEHPPGVQPMPYFFPMRNRVISGLSKAIIVVEAGKKSGTIITVEQALDQGRDVYAVPGNATSKLSEGTNNLIKQGAPLISSYKDVLNELNILKKEQNTKSELEINLINLDLEEKLVYDCISLEPIEIDKIIYKIDMPVNKIQYILVMLELKNYIQRLPGQRYIRSL